MQRKRRRRRLAPHAGFPATWRGQMVSTKQQTNNVAHWSRFAAIVGAEHAIADAERQRPFLHEWRDLYTGRAALIVCPATTPEVAAVVSAASEMSIGIVPQGGNTGLVGGQIPSPTGTEIVLSLSRLNRVREVDPAGVYMIVES